MKIAYIGKKIVNLDNLIWIDTVQDETGKIYCLFVFSKDLTVQEDYKDAEEMRIKFEEYGICRKETKTEELLWLIKEFFRKIATKYKRRKLKIVK